ncbi:hypothetical protein JTB14_016009 [Gonioctena quinquepunctata]|nr:hypothetical protein JTB14_016009 [Gonioctena quinquepunctata]
MRLPSIFLLFFLIAITQAQRRTTAKPDPSSETSRPVTRGRGRSRFVSSPEFQAIKETPQATPDPTSRRIVSRKRVPENIEHKLSPRPTTESIERRSFSPVQEVVDETVHEPFRRLKKTRVLTESNFEAQNPPRRNFIQALPGASEYADSPPPRRQSVQSIPVAQENTVRKVKKLVHQESSTVPPPSNLVEEESNAVEEPVDTTAKSASLEVASEESTSEETQGEILKTQTVSTTTMLPEAPRSQNGGNRRSGARRNPNAFAAEATTSAGRSRMRTRGTRGPDTLFEPAPSAISSRTSRRRIDSTVPVEGTRKGPSVFSADFLPREGRSRTGRRTEALAPEKITLDLPSRDKSSARKKTSSTTKRSIDDPRNRSSWKQSPPSSVTSRGRSRSRDLPPVIDETKLEVLPLFENEPKLVQTDTRSRSRSRSASRTDDVATNFIQESRTKNKLSEELPVQESIQTSATDTDLKLTKPDRVTMSVNVETRSESSLPSRKPTQTSPPKESVVSEVSEITSRRTVLRRKTLRGVIKPSSNDVKPKILIGKLVPGSRGQKKSEIKLDGVVKKGSSDEIDESDNYPETFKALIKAKKGEKESMPASSSARITYSVNSSTTARSTTASGTTREINEQENELIPKSSTSPPSTRSTRNRPLQITTTDKNTANRKLTAPTLSRLSKYKSKYSPPSRNLTALKLDRNVAFRPREGYSTEKNKRKDGYGGRRVTKNAGGPVILSTQIPEYATSSRTSIRGKYRKEFSSRGPVVRSTTNAPRYIPTIPSAPYVPTVPTVTPSRPTANSWTQDLNDYNWSYSRTY